MALDLADIQGLVASAYRRHPWARYVLLRFTGPPSACRAWLAELVTSRAIDSATPKDAASGPHREVRINLAFTASGLRRFGLPSATLADFPTAFSEGLGVPWTDGPDHRSRILGDLDTSAPDVWDWGYQGDWDDRRRVDAVLLAFGLDEAAVDQGVNDWLTTGYAHGAFAPHSKRVLVGSFPADVGESVREPFGFVDGVSQPVLKSLKRQLRLGQHRSQPARHEIEDGELVLGHRDNARQLPPSPSVPATADRHRVLRRAPTDGFDIPENGAGDLGYNGTYLVFRQLEQNVTGFAQQCLMASAALGVTAEQYRAMVVGRWDDGSPLVTCPLGPDAQIEAPPAANDFGYLDDPYGTRCPIGAHVRRANPRDSLVEDPEESWRIANRHRILRRGRPYETTDAKGQVTRGLHFICLNADIVRQFEFIQQNWFNDPGFGGLAGEVDPLVGRSTGAAAATAMGAATAAVGPLAVPPSPTSPLPRRTTLGRYVTVKGGAYFFLPSLTTLRFLSGLAPAARRTAEWQSPTRRASKGDGLRLLMHGRFSFLLAALLALAPIALLLDDPALLALLAPMFRVESGWHMALLTAAASLTAAVAMITWRTVELHAPARFGLRIGWSSALTWKRVLTWQALSLPWIGTTTWQSWQDGSVARLGWGTWLLAVAGGYLVSLLLMAVAERLRSRSVRDTNSEETVILPPSLGRRLRRLLPPGSAGTPPQTGAKAALVAPGRAARELVESYTVMLPPEKGRGYIDHRTGRILPGHLSGVAIAAVAFVLLLFVRWAYRPWDIWFDGQLPPSLYLLTVLSITTFAAAAAAFWLDRWRVPLLSIAVIWTVVSGVFRGADFRYPVTIGAAPMPMALAPGLTPSEALHQADAVLGQGEAGRPVIVVAAGGGGAYQAAWVARVLSGLTETWGDQFTRSVRLVSATSGGAVGAMHFVNHYGVKTVPTAERVSEMVRAAGSPSTGDVWWGVTYYDLARVLPLRLARDRGWALERAWERSLRPRSSRRTMLQWQQDVSTGWRPAMAFNSMAVETGERVALATYKLPGTPAPMSLAQVTDSHDIDVVTAARLSAAFPYVTPFARADAPPILEHLADGGYWDNHGITTALEWLADVEAIVDERHVVFIRIPPPDQAEREAEDRSWGWQITAPVTGLAAMRTNAQRVRGLSALEGYLRERDHRQRERSGAPPSFQVIELPAPGGASLSWHVSTSERCAIADAWVRRVAIDRPRLEAAFGPTSRTPQLPAECRQ